MHCFPIYVYQMFAGALVVLPDGADEAAERAGGGGGIAFLAQLFIDAHLIGLSSYPDNRRPQSDPYGHAPDANDA
jgi:hypothetical protein